MISEISHLRLVAGLPPQKKVYRMPCDLPRDPHGAFCAAWTQVEYSATSKCLGPLSRLLDGDGSKPWYLVNIKIAGIYGCE